MFIEKLEDKVPTFHDKVHESTINQNEKLQRAEKRYLRPAVMGIIPVDKTVARRCFIKKVSVIISKNSLENAFAGASFY